MKAPILESERLIYKPVSMDHLSQEYVDWLNDSEVNRFLETGGDQTISTLKKFLSSVVEKDIYFWAIHLKASEKHIGNIKVDPINFKHGVGEYGILMGEKSEWGKGYAKEGTNKIINYCFSELKLRKITLGVVADNKRAVELYKRLGFTIEGVYKKHGVYEGNYHDIIRMALFNPDFTYNEK